MITAKQLVLLVNKEVSMQSSDNKLALITAFGLIRGRFDQHILDELLDIGKCITAVSNIEFEPATQANVIVLKDVTIQLTGSNTFINVDKMTVFPDQVIAVFVEGEPQIFDHGPRQ